MSAFMVLQTFLKSVTLTRLEPFQSSFIAFMTEMNGMEKVLSLEILRVRANIEIAQKITFWKAK